MVRPSVADAWEGLAHGTKRLDRVRDALLEVSHDLGRVLETASPALSDDQAEVIRDAHLLLVALEQSTRPQMHDWYYRINFLTGKIAARRRGPPGNLRARAARGNAVATVVEERISGGEAAKAAVSTVAEQHSIAESEVWNQVAILRGEKQHPSGARIAFGKRPRET